MARGVAALCGIILLTGCSTIVKGTHRVLVLLIGATAAIAGCAKSPESIAPAYVSAVNFQSWSCSQLAEEARRLNQALAEASTQQRNARTNDTIGVIFIGVPVSSLSGDNIAPQIANLKGQIVAVQQAGNLRNCGLVAELPSG